MDKAKDFLFETEREDERLHELQKCYINFSNHWNSQNPNPLMDLRYSGNTKLNVGPTRLWKESRQAAITSYFKASGLTDDDIEKVMQYRGWDCDIEEHDLL